MLEGREVRLSKGDEPLLSARFISLCVNLFFSSLVRAWLEKSYRGDCYIGVYSWQQTVTPGHFSTLWRWNKEQGYVCVHAVWMQMTHVRENMTYLLGSRGGPGYRQASIRAMIRVLCKWLLDKMFYVSIVPLIILFVTFVSIVSKYAMTQADWLSPRCFPLCDLRSSLVVEGVYLWRHVCL